jgi:hypothetical protein
MEMRECSHRLLANRRERAGAAAEQKESRREVTNRAQELRRWAYAAWMVAIGVFAVLHATNLRADFPNGSPWVFDWAKYTDEGWYGNAAARAHLFGNWYVAGDFNPAVAVPVWPFAEWVLYFFTGVRVEAARALAIACFFASLVLSYLLVRAGGADGQATNDGVRAAAPKWMGLLAVTLVVTSPFLYCFSRLAILEPLQAVLTLAALNLAMRLPTRKRPVMGSAWVGFLFALMMLTKTTSLFLAPAVAWAILAPLWERRRLAMKCALVAALNAAVAYGVWVIMVAALGLMKDYKYFFFVNKYPKPAEFYWPLVSFWWSLHGMLWVDHSLVVMAGMVAVGSVLVWRSEWARTLWRAPLFGCSLWVVAGYVFFMTIQDHPQPRYFAQPASFCFFAVALGVGVLLQQPGLVRWMGAAVLVLVLGAAGVHGAQTVSYTMHPEYTFVTAAAELTRYIDAHPNGKRLMVSISGDEITLMTHIQTLCDDFGTEDLTPKLAQYEPGWYASWNDLDPGTLLDLHMNYSLEQVATFRAFDDPDRNLLVLFKLHPLPEGTERDPDDPTMKAPLPDDKIDVPVE